MPPPKVGIAKRCFDDSLFKVMSARDIIRQIEALSPEEQREVLAYLDAKKSEIQRDNVGRRMNFKDAKTHVFTTYRDVLEKLAK